MMFKWLQEVWTHRLPCYQEITDLEMISVVVSGKGDSWVGFSIFLYYL